MPGISIAKAMIHRTAWDWCRSLQCALLAAGLAASGVADACTLDALLRMPLEQLLELKVGQSGCPPSQSKSGTPQPRIVAGGRA
jgi:hypothetical protein